MKKIDRILPYFLFCIFVLAMFSLFMSFCEFVEKNGL